MGAFKTYGAGYSSFWLGSIVSRLHFARALTAAEAAALAAGGY